MKRLPALLLAAACAAPFTACTAEDDLLEGEIVKDEDGKTDITFTVPKADMERAVECIKGLKSKIGYEAIKNDANVVKLSVIGVGMRSHAGVAQRMFKTLSDKGINIQVISTSEIKISVLIAEEYTELALRALHTAYGLDGE